MDATATFARYQALRPRLPNTVFPDHTVQIGSLLEIADQGDVFVFDAFGVLNVGDSPIAGAPERIRQLRALGKQVFVLTNAASSNRGQIVQKFARFGFDFADSEIISSRDAALAAVADYPEVKHWGVIVPASHTASDLEFNSSTLTDEASQYAQVDGFLFLGAALWTAARQKLLQQALSDHPRPLIIANPDLVAPREYGLSLEPGYYAHALADLTGHIPAFHGKPYGSVYDLLRMALPAEQNPARIIMMGDTLHTDILGAAAQGWRSVLVTEHGLFTGLDVAPFIAASGIRPDWQLGSI